MFYIPKILILLGLIKLLDQETSPLVCSAVYTAVSLMLTLLSTTNIEITQLLLNVILSFASSFIYFWILKKLQGTGILRFLVVAAGAVIGLV